MRTPWKTLFSTFIKFSLAIALDVGIHCVKVESEVTRVEQLWLTRVVAIFIGFGALITAFEWL